MSKNILILSGSPRKGGNSDILCDRFMEGARESGHRAEKVFLRDKNIGYCIGCEACHQNNGRLRAEGRYGRDSGKDDRR
ncbi:MAG: NAD(P)H-dependent oxidoreductase [Bilophila wadsworthia]|uniref:flavodoxin family protein n=1 Tax=Bilophila wadsworthia TaxID=35833 RepID=UPI00300F4F96